MNVPEGSGVDQEEDLKEVKRLRSGPRRPDLETLYCIDEDGSHHVIHPADVRGRFQRIKKAVWTILVVIYVALPWIRIGGHPAILIDIPRRHFFLFGHTFNAMDFWLAFFFLAGVGLTLILLSALYGRVWCGYACPQTVFLEGFYRRIERWIEGTAPQREKLARSPWTVRKILKKGGKHFAYLVLSLVLAHVFLSYFIPVRELGNVVTSSPAAHPAAFVFVMALTAVMMFNFAWFREQLCLIICPYGRLQSILSDPDTIVVGYDARRGEPRGRYNREGRGDCIDCYRCVAVCPTGIDIRFGLQLECIGCANCIDACDEVMDKLGQARGLIRNDSLNGFEGRRSRFWRPRVVAYFSLLALVFGGFVYATSKVEPIEARFVRLPGPAYVIEGGKIRNQFRLRLLVKEGGPRHVSIEPLSPEGAEFIFSQRDFDLPLLEYREVMTFVSLPRSSFRQGTAVEVWVRFGEERRTVRAPFVGPDD